MLMLISSRGELHYHQEEIENKSLKKSALFKPDLQELFNSFLLLIYPIYLWGNPFGDYHSLPVHVTIQNCPVYFTDVMLLSSILCFSISNSAPIKHINSRWFGSLFPIFFSLSTLASLTSQIATATPNTLGNVEPPVHSLPASTPQPCTLCSFQPGPTSYWACEDCLSACQPSSTPSCCPMPKSTCKIYLFFFQMLLTVVPGDRALCKVSDGAFYMQGPD